MLILNAIIESHVGIINAIIERRDKSLLEKIKSLFLKNDIRDFEYNGTLIHLEK